MKATTYTVAVGSSWHDHDGSPAPDYDCGHAHKSVEAAEMCGAKLYDAKYVGGSWQACAKWHNYYIVDNSTGQKVG